ncbi:hypothetical protein [Lacticaseibacillus daqingensis]|uniref:hypothetical protein n=1 Tax=Lacticaseibacillus daqingensis TaxID=2486014 RepID=UPI000F7AD7E5|nr:hypothetical protein [Lacticaseibacillus daqingensis]
MMERKLSEAELQKWLRERKQERLTLWVSAVVTAVMFVAACYMGNLFTYWFRFGPALFVLVALEDTLVTYHQRRRHGIQRGEGRNDGAFRYMHG